MLYGPGHATEKVSASPFKNIFRIIQLAYHVTKKMESLLVQLKLIFLVQYWDLKEIGGKFKKGAKRRGYNMF